MILSELKSHLKVRGVVSLEDLAMHFDTEPSALDGMLAFWIDKGKINKQVNRPLCTACSGCNIQSQTLYSWKDRLEEISINLN